MDDAGRVQRFDRSGDLADEGEAALKRPTERGEVPRRAERPEIGEEGVARFGDGPHGKDPLQRVPRRAQRGQRAPQLLSFVRGGIRGERDQRGRSSVLAPHPPRREARPAPHARLDSNAEFLRDALLQRALVDHAHHGATENGLHLEL